MSSDPTTDDVSDDGRCARLWARNAIAELTVAINEAASVISSPDDKVAAGYLGNVRSALAKANEYTLRAKIMFERQ